MRKKFLLQVSVATLATFLILGCAKKREGTRPDSARLVREEETKGRRGERKMVGAGKEFP